MKKSSIKILSIALALMLALTLCVPALADDTAPDDGLATRGDLVKWLYSEYGSDKATENLNIFSDIPADSDEAAAAAWAADLGIIKGYGDGRFGPADRVTREQAATMLYRFAQTMGQGFQGMWYFLLDAPDAAEISDWADEAMHWVVANGVITEREAGLAPKDFIGINELPVWMRSLDDALNVKLENGGYTLSIPAGIAAKLNTEMPADVPEGTLFTVAEQASIDAAAAKGYDGSGMGWLFAIQKISEAEAHQLLCGDMSGRQLFAKDAEGNHFLFCTPTDVRFDRETTEQMMEDSAVWAQLNEWAASVKDSFVNDNGLIPESYGNTELDVALYRVAYDESVKYTLSTTAFGPLEPDAAVDAAAFVQRALNGVTFTYADTEAVPDGEYVVLNFPETGERFDFFDADGNLVRRVTEYGEFCLRASYDDDAARIHDTMEEWYFALASAKGLQAENP